MDTSFTFVTALTPAKGKIKGVPKFPKPFNEKLKESKFKITKHASQTCKPSASKICNKVINDSSSSTSQKTTSDSIPSLKSCSDSLHLSSDRSLPDHNEDGNKSSTAPFDQSRSSATKTPFEKLIHSGLERLTFRKKRIQKFDDENKVNHYDNCLAQLTHITITDDDETKPSRPIENCDRLLGSCDKVESLSTEDLNDLPGKMLNLSLEKLKKPLTILQGSSINKKLFNSTINMEDQSSSARATEKVDSFFEQIEKNKYPTDSSGIISEDISPIPRFSIAPSTNIYRKSDDFTFPGNNFEIDERNQSDHKLEIPSKISLEEKPTKILKKPVAKTTKVKDNKKKAISVLSEVNYVEEKLQDEIKENKTKVKTNEKSVRPRIKKPAKKKKDSFIVSDTSSIDNESMSEYRKFISENIKFDVIKTTTPRSKYKNNADFHDDGIFTPFIIKGKRSSSEDDFSEKENDDGEGKKRVKKIRWSSSEDEDFPITRKSLLPSLTALSENEKKNQSPSTDLKVSSKEIKADKKLKKTQPKKKGKTKPTNRLNISSDLSKSSTESLKSDLYNELTSSPSFTAGSSVVEKKKYTPITFKLKNLKNLAPVRTPGAGKEPLSFLRSLSTLTSPHMIHPDAAQYRKSFKKLKEELAKKLFTLFNKEVFENKLPDDLKIEWNARMRSSSGLCYNKRIKTIIGPNNECLRVSRIALSTKIIETPERLRDTLVHEMCHAAAWIIDNKADGHGPCWRSWANKAQRRFPELPPIKRCHDYTIQTKFKYRCVNCGYTIGRHSKSLNLERKRCGYCYGRFELVLNQEISKGVGTGVSPKNVKARPLSKFALFVKENYGKIKSENAALKHADVMKLLSKNFADTKT